MLMGLLLGMACHFVGDIKRMQLGLDLMAGPALRFGVALLALRLTFSDLVQLGWQSVLSLIAAIGLTIIMGVISARLLKVDRALGILTGGAVAICGASAAMAIASVLPESENKQKLTSFTVIGVASFSTFAMIFYPVIGDYLGLDDQAMGFFIGAAIHDVAQVVGAGYSVSLESGDAATLVKLFRVAMLIPVVALITVWITTSHSDPNVSRRIPRVPLFLVGFLVLFTANSTGWIPVPVSQSLAGMAPVLLLLAITALGMRTSLRDIIEIGVRPCDFTGARNAFLGSAGIAFSRLTVGRCVGASVAIMLRLGAVSSECDLQGWRQYSIDGVVNRGATLRCPVQSDAIVTLHGLVCRDSKVSRTDVSCTDK